LLVVLVNLCWTVSFPEGASSIADAENTNASYLELHVTVLSKGNWQ